MELEGLNAAASSAEWVTAGATIAVAVVALVGFGATLHTLIAARNRQRMEIEGYVRVDVGPPEGTGDYIAPTEFAFRNAERLEVLGDAPEDAPMMVAWYTNLQTHPLGTAHGVVARLVAALEDLEGNVYLVRQTHEIAYIEPGKCVRIDVVQFPRDWQAELSVGAVRYRNLHWDGATPRHGRRQCIYEDSSFRMIPWSDPVDSFRDRAERLFDRMIGFQRGMAELFLSAAGIAGRARAIMRGLSSRFRSIWERNRRGNRR